MKNGVKEQEEAKEAFERARDIAIEKGLYIYGAPNYLRRDPGRDTEDHPAKRSKRG